MKHKLTLPDLSSLYQRCPCFHPKTCTSTALNAAGRPTDEEALNEAQERLEKKQPMNPQIRTME